MKKKDMNKQVKIQDAVAAIILAEGPAGVSTTKVAKRVGIAQSNVYLYFKNKQALIDSVYARETNRILSTTDLDRLSDSTIDVTNNIVANLLTAAIDAKVIKQLPVSLHMGVVFSTIHTHTTNISKGRYAQDQYTFGDIFQMIWDAMKQD